MAVQVVTLDCAFCGYADYNIKLYRLTVHGTGAWSSSPSTGRLGSEDGIGLKSFISLH